MCERSMSETETELCSNIIICFRRWRWCSYLFPQFTVLRVCVCVSLFTVKMHFIVLFRCFFFFICFISVSHTLSFFFVHSSVVGISSTCLSSISLCVTRFSFFFAIHFNENLLLLNRIVCDFQSLTLRQMLNFSAFHFCCHRVSRSLWVFSCCTQPTWIKTNCFQFTMTVLFVSLMKLNSDAIAIAVCLVLPLLHVAIRVGCGDGNDGGSCRYNSACWACNAMAHIQPCTMLHFFGSSDITDTNALKPICVCVFVIFKYFKL